MGGERKLGENMAILDESSANNSTRGKKNIGRKLGHNNDGRENNATWGENLKKHHNFGSMKDGGEEIVGGGRKFVEEDGQGNIATLGGASEESRIEIGSKVEMKAGSARRGSVTSTQSLSRQTTTPSTKGRTTASPGGRATTPSSTRTVRKLHTTSKEVKPKNCNYRVDKWVVKEVKGVEPQVGSALMTSSTQGTSSTSTPVMTTTTSSTLSLSLSLLFKMHMRPLF